MPQKPICKTSFKKLQKEWYKKLKDSGFNDIEVDKDFNIMQNFTNDNFSKLKKNLALGQKNPEDSAKFRYHVFASQFYYDHKFKNSQEKAIWYLHVQGVSQKKIVKSLGVGIRKVELFLKRTRNGPFKEYIEKRVKEIESDKEFSNKILDL